MGGVNCRRQDTIVNFFGVPEASIYKGWGVWSENIFTFFSFLFGSMKRKPLYLSQQTTKQILTIMKKTRLHGTVTYDYSQILPTGFEGYEFIFNGITYFIPLQSLGIQTEKYRVMNYTTDNSGTFHSLTDTMLEANTLAEIKRFAKYML